MLNAGLRMSTPSVGLISLRDYMSSAHRITIQHLTQVFNVFFITGAALDKLDLAVLITCYSKPLFLRGQSRSGYRVIESMKIRAKEAEYARR